jgi:hypothetical protein
LLAGEAWTLKDMAQARVVRGDLAAARASLATASKIFEQIGDQAGTAETVSLLASLTAELAGPTAGRQREGPLRRNALSRTHAVRRLDFAGASNTQ